MRLGVFLTPCLCLMAMLSWPGLAAGQGADGEKTDAARARWQGYQTKMNSAFLAARARRDKPPARRAAWDNFLRAFAAENPFSKTDDALRVEAKRLRAKIKDPAKTAPRTAEPEPQPKSAKSPEKPAQAGQPPGMDPGSTFQDCAACPEMVVIPAGSFRMGDLTGQGPRSEQPPRQVTIGQPFALGKYEITAGQFAKFVVATGHQSGGGCWTYEEGEWEKDKGKSWRSPGFPQISSNPLVCVNWQDAKAYAAWLSKETGKAYRLPTEAQWEYAARAGTESVYHFGQTAKDICTFANGADLSTPFAWRNQACDDNWSDVAPIGSLRENRFGLHDMHGNVWEWVEDCWSDSHAGAPTDESARRTDDCQEHVLRGGSWLGRLKNLRSASRVGRAATNRNHSVGFRLARPLLGRTP